MPSHKIQHDSLLLLDEYLPTIYSLIKDVSKYNKNIIQLYDKKYGQIKKDIELKGEYIGQTTIFDLLWEASEQIPRKKEFLSFIDSLVSKITLKIDDLKINQVRKICYRMISNFSKDQSQYTRCLAELCVLEKIVSSKKFTLIQIEKKFENGKSFDFHFRSHNQETYVEVYTIDFEIEKLESEEDFQNFLTHRIEAKINSKLNGLRIDKIDFNFVSVLSGNIKELTKFKNVFESFREYRFLSPFMMISECISPNNECIYTFESVTTFLRRNKNVEDRNKTI